MKKICMSVFFASAVLLGAAETMTVSRDGDNIEIRTDFPGGYTLHQTGWAKGPNRQFNFNRVMLNKGKSPLFTVKYSGDDACPWHLNSTYIGANHGDSINSGLIFSQPHGLTEKDCGSKWSDPRGRNFYIMKMLIFRGVDTLFYNVIYRQELKIRPMFLGKTLLLGHK